MAIKTRKITVGSDAQIPDHKDEQVHKVIEESGDILVWNGDMLDVSTLSTFLQTGQEDYLASFKTMVEYNQKALDYYGKIVHVPGNHEDRHKKYLLKNLPTHLRSFVPTEICQLLKTARLYDNDGRVVELVDTKTRKAFESRMSYAGEHGEDRWWILIGDVAIMHPTTYIRRDMGTSVHALQYLYKRGYGTDTKVVVVAHTHHAGKFFVDTGKCIVEGGCLCYEGDYSHSGKLSYSPATNAYVTLEQEYIKGEWVTDLDSVLVHCLGPARNMVSTNAILKI